MALPELADLEFNETDIEEVTGSIKKSFLFDFQSGEFLLKDGKIQETAGVESLKTWIQNTLRTEKGKYKVYIDTEYGISKEDLIGSNYSADFVEEELKREVEESLLVHPCISAITDFSLTKESILLTISFSVTTTEREELEVEYNGYQDDRGNSQRNAW